MRLILSEAPAGLDVDGKAMLKHYMSPNVRAEFEQKVETKHAKQQDAEFAGFFYIAVSHLQENCKRLTKMGLIAGNPQEGGQLSAQMNGLIAGFNSAVKAVDIFRDPATGRQSPFPITLSLIGHVVVLVFCLMGACEDHPSCVYATLVRASTDLLIQHAKFMQQWLTDLAVRLCVTLLCRLHLHRVPDRPRRDSPHSIPAARRRCRILCFLQ